MRARSTSDVLDPVNSACAMVGVDWGTTSLRLCSMDATGRALDHLHSDDGILKVGSSGFERTLEERLDRWRVDRGIPIVLSGMITSRAGWIETPYLPVPCALTDLARRLVAHVSTAGRRLWFVPGVMQSPGAVPLALHDVMRGEETEMLGRLVASDDQNGWFVLPGTHAKWVRLKDRRIHHFCTFMTGEVFAALTKHTILGRTMTEEAPFDPEGFAAGIDACSHGSGSLLARLFSVRAMPLLDAMPASRARDYLAGLLIGTEITDMLARGASSPVVIGRGDLVERYLIALERLGSAGSSALPNSAARGQHEIARIAGLLPHPDAS